MGTQVMENAAGPFPLRRTDRTGSEELIRTGPQFFLPISRFFPSFFRTFLNALEQSEHDFP